MAMHIKATAYRGKPWFGYCEVADEYVRLRRCRGMIDHEECERVRELGLFNQNRTKPQRERVTKPLRSHGPVYGVERRNIGTPPTV